MSDPCSLPPPWLTDARAGFPRAVSSWVLVRRAMTRNEAFDVPPRFGGRDVVATEVRERPRLRVLDEGVDGDLVMDGHRALTRAVRTLAGGSRSAPVKLKEVRGRGALNPEASRPSRLFFQ